MWGGEVVLFAGTVSWLRDWSWVFVAFVAAAVLWWLLSRLRRTTLDRIDRMDGREFELFLGNVFEALGYEVTVTQASRDFGADLLLEDGEGYKIAIQAKRYDQAVGIDAVQQIAAAVPYYAVHEGWVVTNSTFTASAYELAEPNGVRLVSREELVSILREAGYSR